MENVNIFGFGSFFNNNTKFNDIDILLLHQSISYESCQFSLRCKKYLLANLINAHITILSLSEEHQLDFFNKSKAKYLGKIYEESAEYDLNVILNTINGVKNLE
jgi:hypothetical protein